MINRNDIKVGDIICLISNIHVNDDPKNYIWYKVKESPIFRINLLESSHYPTPHIIIEYLQPTYQAGEIRNTGQTCIMPDACFYHYIKYQDLLRFYLQNAGTIIQQDNIQSTGLNRLDLINHD